MMTVQAVGHGWADLGLAERGARIRTEFPSASPGDVDENDIDDLDPPSC